MDPITSRVQMATRNAISVTPSGSTATAPGSPDEALRGTAKQLEGLFVQQLFKAMRETVPEQEGIVSGGAGEDIFTGLLDEHLAAETPNQWGGGLSDALYRQLRGAMPPTQSPAAPTPSGTLSR
jgi:flagellar protein FlgJ